MKLALFISTYLLGLLAHAQDYKVLVNLANDSYTKKSMASRLSYTNEPSS